MMAEATQAHHVNLRPLLPLYLVIFIAFCGYALMVTLFIPMLMGDYGFVPQDAPVARRTAIVEPKQNCGSPANVATSTEGPNWSFNCNAAKSEAKPPHDAPA